MLETYLKLLELDFFEVTEAFKGLADENVWKRPAPGLLSVGELAGHVAYWLAIRFAGEGENLSKCKIRSPLIDARFRYYSSTVDLAASDEQLAMGAEAVCAELLRVHKESVAKLMAENPPLNEKLKGLDGWTHEENLKYTIFHVAYHTGQMYSARHLLGEETPDN